MRGANGPLVVGRRCALYPSPFALWRTSQSCGILARVLLLLLGFKVKGKSRSLGDHALSSLLVEKSAPLHLPLSAPPGGPWGSLRARLSFSIPPATSCCVSELLRTLWDLWVGELSPPALPTGSRSSDMREVGVSGPGRLSQGTAGQALLWHRCSEDYFPLPCRTPPLVFRGRCQH